jgi:uncharacterized protein (DUF1015 family)
VGFNAEPVLMTYPDNHNIADIVKKERAKEPLYLFTTADGTTHTLWAIMDDRTIIQLQREFGALESLYIADGHHRSASSVLLADKQQKSASTNGEAASNYFMSYLIPESEIRILGFNRLVKDLNGHTKDGFLGALEHHYTLEDRGREPYVPQQKQEFCMYLDGCFYVLRLKKDTYPFHDPLDRLDTQILYKTILGPILGITDLRNDRRIKYVFHRSIVEGMRSEIDAGNFRVGFGMLPIRMEEIKDIADAGLVMPPKSTYIEPKLRSGLTIYEI